jgi:hypothetical protein
MATQRTQIYLEGVSVDLDKNIDTDLTYSIADIEDFETRKTTYSKTVSIPATANNNFLFGNYFDANIENPYDSLVENVGINFNPLKKAFVQVMVDNVEVFAGVLRLLEIKQIEDGSIVYECALFGSLGGLFTAVGDKMLTDLDWSAYSAPFNLFDIVASWSRTDWIYTMANYGLVTATYQSEWSFKINSFRPSFFLKTIYNKILEEAGYTSNNFFTNNLEKLLFINGDENYSIYITNLATGNFFAGNTITQDTSRGPLALIKTSGYLDIQSLYIDNTLDSELDVNVSGTIDYKLNSSSLLPRVVKLQLYININTLIAEHSHTMTSIGNGSFSYNFNVKIPTNSFLSFQFAFVGGGQFSFNRFQTSTFSVISNNKSLKAPIKQGIGSIDGKNFVPDGMKQSDFLKALFNLFNLYITPNPENEFDLVVKPYPNFYTTNEVDWTYKVDNNKGFSVKPSNQYLPKSFIYKYKDDNDYYSKVYKNKYGVSFGSYIKATDNEFSKDDKTIEIPFSLPITARFGLNSDMYLPAMYDLNPDGTYKQVQTNPKLAFFGGIKDCSNYKVVDIDGSSNDNTNLTYPYLGHLYDFATDGSLTPNNLFDVAFNKPQDIYYTQLVDYPENNLYKFYYEGYVYNLNSKDSKLVGLYLLLNNIDIKNIDFTKLVRIGTTLYYLNLVDGYNPLSNELTKVELLKYNPL